MHFNQVWIDTCLECSDIVSTGTVASKLQYSPNIVCIAMICLQSHVYNIAGLIYQYIIII